jgi:hypothetical protein
MINVHRADGQIDFRSQGVRLRVEVSEGTATMQLVQIAGGEFVCEVSVVLGPKHASQVCDLFYEVSDLLPRSPKLAKGASS